LPALGLRELTVPPEPGRLHPVAGTMRADAGDGQCPPRP
jgi:hypothetical protein